MSHSRLAASLSTKASPLLGAMASMFAICPVSCTGMPSEVPRPDEPRIEQRTEVESSPPVQPNILFVYLDDFGWRDAGFMGSDFFETPNLDALAAGGVVFQNAYAAAANCAPSRASLLSGQYTPRHRIYNVGTRPRGKAKHRRLAHVPGVRTLDPNIRTWAHALQGAGYRTATVGKWHLSDDPLPYGFHHNVGGTHAGSPPKGYYPPHPNTPGLEDALEGGEYLTDRLTAEACDFIRAHQADPWMVYLTHFAVHTPLNAKKELLAKYRAKAPGKLHQHIAMATMIQAVDDGVGELVATLEELGLMDNTIILFGSDNGGYGPATDMAPLRGYKGTYFEGGIRVPFFAHWRGVIEPGQTRAEPVTGVDLFPTLCALAGATLPEGQVLDGMDLSALMTGRSRSARQGPRALFWHFPAYLEAHGPWDEQRDPLFRSRPCSVIRKGPWKLIEYLETGAWELFDLEADVGEARNLAEMRPDVAKELHSELHAWRAATGAAMPLANPAFDPQAEAAAIQRRVQKAAQTGRR